MRPLCCTRSHTTRFTFVLLALTLAALGTNSPCFGVDADVLLRGGTIYDGSGAEARVGDVAIQGERIAATGEFEIGTIGRAIDCTGLIVAPGFIDLHTHCDRTITKSETRDNLNYLTQGCTTVVTGNCGLGMGDVKKLLDEVDELGAGTNIAHLIPQGSVRKAVLGDKRREANDDELRQMRKLIDEGMRAGAWGVSTGLIYAPGCYAETDELVALCERCAAHGGLYATHMRGEGSTLLESIQEALEIGQRATIPAHISHFKSAGKGNWGRLRDAVALVEEARQKGQAVTADQYPYTASSTSMDAILLPHSRIPGGRNNLPKRMEDDEDFDQLVRKLIRSSSTRGPEIVIAASKTDRWRGRSLAEIAESENIDFVDLVLLLHKQGGVKVVNFCMSEEDVCFGMAVPWVATASDGSGHVARPGGSIHPRSFGTFPRKIGRFALKREVLPLAQAIRSCTGLPADILGLPERGYLRKGTYADIVVFDPKTYIDRATFKEPTVLSTGVRHLFLAGNLSIEEGEPSEELYGRALRHKSTLAIQ